MIEQSTALNFPQTHCQEAFRYSCALPGDTTHLSDLFFKVCLSKTRDESVLIQPKTTASDFWNWKEKNRYFLMLLLLVSGRN